MKRAALLLPLMAALAAAPLHAQTQDTAEKEDQAKGARSFRVFGALNFPTSDTGDAASTGWGLGLQFTRGQGAFALFGEVGYDHFGIEGVEGLPPGTDYGTDLNPWHFGGGAKVAVGPINVAGLVGYWTDIEDFDLVPIVGVKIWRLQTGVRYKGLFGDGDWIALTVGFGFGKKK
ncbi:MAG TPA: hypothetical protein VJU15_00340 [Gemmatimonadales bacterium]|nr:hypothetical protein [Gemmatimonadales bacterium]